MASESELEGESESENGDSRGLENKRKNRASVSSMESNPVKRVKSRSTSFLVGMKLVDGKKAVEAIFKDQHWLGRYIEGYCGPINSVRATRSGLVIIDCMSKSQRESALEIKRYRDCEVECFVLTKEPRKRGVISGVPWSVDAEEFEQVEGVDEARRLMRYRKGDNRKEESKSICLTFHGEVPDRVFLDYVCYRVRLYERAPLRCFSCQEYGHVAAVCRGYRKCGRCGDDDCVKEDCIEEERCLHCEGNHRVGSAQCPRRIREVRVIKVREEKGVTYAEAVKNMDRKEEREVVKEPESSGKGQIMGVDKKGFLAFMAFVINCAMEIEGKSERIKMVLDAARKFLNIEDVSGQELNDTLQEACKPT